MKVFIIYVASCLVAAGLFAADVIKKDSEFTVQADRLEVSRVTGELSAKGNVRAAVGPVRIFAESAERAATGDVTLGHAEITTCTNDYDHLHWKIGARMQYKNGKSFEGFGAVPYVLGVPFAYVPYLFYPINTNYGLRVFPGYTSKWGGYLLTGYVYNLINEDKKDAAYALGASTYADYRTKRGFAVGQTLRWRLGDLGKGKIKLYHAWDRDYDEYQNDDDYRNWTSDVKYRRYRIALEHAADVTPRDRITIQGSYLSDSMMQSDFFDRDNRGESTPLNFIAYEHRELSYAFGANVSGPINRFYGGVARLPEVWFAVMPQPLFGPFNYESQTRAGLLNRNYAEFSGVADDRFRYSPGAWADYQTFRLDTAHRVTLPMKWNDVLSVVPRVGYRGTYYNDTGTLNGQIATADGNALYRHTADLGVEVSLRGTAQLNDTYRHVLEPYLDYSYQPVSTDVKRGKRTLRFDRFDYSYGWLDQFGVDGRWLPYTWHGVRPGVRNLIQKKEADGLLRTVLDIDTYVAIQINDRADANDTHWEESPNYDDGAAMYGTRILYMPTRTFDVQARAEWDGENDVMAYTDVKFQHRLSDSFRYGAGYYGRDHEFFDYGAPLVPQWNREKENILYGGFTHDINADWSWSLYSRYDARRNGLDEVGGYLEYRLDCICFRLVTSYVEGYTRIDGTKYDSDVRVSFLMWLRCEGANASDRWARW